MIDTIRRYEKGVVQGMSNQVKPELSLIDSNQHDHADARLFNRDRREQTEARTTTCAF